MDDDILINRDNPLVNGNLTPWTIWFQTDFTLATFGWWAQRCLWGQNPAGYHFVCMVLHAISGMVLWRLLSRLKIPGAWLAAVLFVVHPVCVNSVARVAELKNTLSLPFYLFAFLGYLHYEAEALYAGKPDQAGDHPSRGQATLWYVLSLLAYVLALLSKTTAVMLPPLLIACAIWQRGRITRRDLLHLLPFFILALAFGLMSIWFQKHQALVSARLSLEPMTVFERLAAAGQDFWFYAGKALMPVNLSVIYVRSKIDAASFAAYLPALFTCGLFIVCWCFRRNWGRHALFGLACFAISLFPVLGFFDAQFLTMFRVSDHLHYKPLIALVALATALLAANCGWTTFRCLGIVLVLSLSVLSFKRAEVFATQETLMRDTLAKNPTSWASYNDLGIIYGKRGDYDAAIRLLRDALRYNPDFVDAHLNLGTALILQGKSSEAESQFLAVLKIKPLEPEAHRQLAEIREAQGKDPEALYHLKVALLFKPEMETRLSLARLSYKTGDSVSAVKEFRRVIVSQPDQAEALNNLAWILATSPENGVRDGGEAVRCAERACHLTAFKRTEMVSTLAAAYAEAGRFPEAVRAAETAGKLAADTGEIHMVDINNQLLRLYRAGIPYHESPLTGRAP